ncbi:MAG TPA: hypothetical protein VIL42_03145 [Sphingomicrobium sp.]|jgi:hypothetical protein
MSDSKGHAAPDSGDEDPGIDELMADPDIAALLDFDPVPMRKRVNGWSADAQRAFVAAVAATGSKDHAVNILGRSRAGMDRILDRDDADSLRAAVDAAFAHYEAKHGAALARNVAHAAQAAAAAPRPRRGVKEQVQLLPEPGQVMNEQGEWEDEESFQRRGADAATSIARKLLLCRRAFLAEISTSPGKRAAFEILTELPVDWEKADRMEAQDDEPANIANQRQPDMVLTAESGWSFGEIGYGEDKKAELRKQIDEHRAEEGLEPVDWSESAEDSEQARSAK